MDDIKDQDIKDWIIKVNMINKFDSIFNNKYIFILLFKY